MLSKQDIKDFNIKQDEAVVVYHAGPNKFGQFSLTVLNWVDNEVVGKDMVTNLDLEAYLRQNGLKIRRIDERPSAMR